MTTGVVTTSFPRYPGDFAGCFVEDAVRAQVAAGQMVDVIAAGTATTSSAAPHDAPRIDRPDLPPAVRVLRVRMPSGGVTSPLFFGAGAPEVLEQGGVQIWAQAAFFWVGLCERIRERAPFWDRMVAHWLVPCALAARAVAPQLRLTAYAHAGDVALLERITGGPSLARRLAHQTDDLIFVSSDLRDRFARLTGIVAGRVGRVRPAATAPAPAPDPLARQTVREALGVNHSVVLSVGRLVPIKGFDVLLRAVAIATAAGPMFRQAPPTVVILGEGSERSRLHDMAHRLNIDLRLPGRVMRPEVGRWMSGADLYVQPSRRLASGRTEGLPTATLEAVATGLPVIASATGGLIELARSLASAPACRIRLVPPDDASALGACLCDWASPQTWQAPQSA